MGAFKDRLATLKRRNKMTAKEVAAKCDVAPSTVFSWLAGTSIPRMGNMTKLAAAMDVTSDYLVHGDRPVDREAAVDKLRLTLPSLTTHQILILAQLSAELAAGNKH